MALLALVGVFTARLSLAQTCNDGFHLFDHPQIVNGPLCLPDHPRRVLALEMSGVEMTLFAGKQLVGTADWVLNELPVLLPELADVLDAAVSIGYPANLEAVLLADPDIILTTEDAIDVASASTVAPVVVASPDIYVDWRLGAELWSAVLSVPEVYEKMTATYDARVAALQRALGERRKELAVSVVSVSTYGVSLWLPDTAPGTILTEVGLARPEAQMPIGNAATERYGTSQYIPISDERLDLADGDVIFLFTYAARDPETRDQEAAFLAAFTQNPVWQSLSAVRSGDVHEVGGHWWRAYTYLLANRVLDDLFIHLTDTDPKTVPAPLPLKIGAS